MSAIELAAIIAGYSMALLRVASAARWSWGFLPPWAQVLVPAMVTALPAFAAQLGAVQTSLDLTEAIVVFLGALGTAWRGTLPAKGGKGDDDPPAGPKPAGLAMMMMLALSLVACSPAHWAAQARVAEAVEVVATQALVPTLEREYEAAGRRAVAASSSREEFAMRLDIIRAQWEPIWLASEAFVVAHAVWVSAIESEGDTVATGAAARDAYCQLRAVAAAKVKLPDFPVPGLECE